MESESSSLILLLEFALRGGTTGIGLLMAGLLFSVRPVCATTFLGGLFAIGAAVYAMISAPAIQEAVGAAYAPLRLFAMLSPAFFWLFIMAMFDDDFEWKAWMAIPPATIDLVHLAALPFPDAAHAARVAHVAIVIVLMAHVLVLTRRNFGDDLVAARRQFTTIVVVLVPLVCLTIVVVATYEMLELRSTVASPMIAAMLFAVAAAFGFGISGIRKSLIPETGRPRPQPEAVSSAADRHDLARLEKLMEEGIFLHPGLTIGELAGRLDIPEHRLRRLINKGLGYRNFAAFLNDHRIEEARRRLSDPQSAREQITGLAFDLGYSSLAPFNRAFRERMGMSPSQFREKALQQA
ncbi:AraC family transcriptional regulator [Oricola thermophila]|uniref:Helix-turn-helix transcriptional regulator n=1 Tax=Oricola thermophila TaxID=2742145 RepID=A0A6N1VCT6_9HYPH|nr:AraC family transcriptional regulator [Oricola thermophila]QKV17385.1 helix-turn-helix transcriptional regulator [Oricola thermophila]